jgi:hypothetical protein
MPNSSNKVDLVKTERNKTHLFIVDKTKVNISGYVGYSLDKDKCIVDFIIIIIITIIDTVLCTQLFLLLIPWYKWQVYI